MRRTFADEVYKLMRSNPDVWVVVGDLGYKMWDQVRDNFPKRFINTGAAETSMMALAVGLALEGKIPFVYSATAFLLGRPFEVIRNYISHEKISVKLVGGGRDRDYLNEGYSHWAEDAPKLLKLFPQIKTLWPETKEEIPGMVAEMLKSQPYFISLRRI